MFPFALFQGQSTRIGECQGPGHQTLTGAADVAVSNMHPFHVYTYARPCRSTVTLCYRCFLGPVPCLRTGDAGCLLGRRINERIPRGTDVNSMKEKTVREYCPAGQRLQANHWCLRFNLCQLTINPDALAGVHFGFLAPNLCYRQICSSKTIRIAVACLCSQIQCTSPS